MITTSVRHLAALVSLAFALLLPRIAQATTPLSQFVAVGQSGTILTSLDGTTWTARTSGTSARLRAAVASSSLLVAVGETGTILTSPDGVTWSSQTSGVSETLRGVAASPTRFVAVGGQTASLIRYSNDGFTWSAATTVPSLGALRAVTYGNGQFVAVGASGTVLTSPDGLTWTQQNANSSERLDGALWSGTKYTVLTSSAKVLTSTDGITWSSAQSTPPSWIESVTWSGTLFVAVGSGGEVKTSPDGTTWTRRTSGTTNTIHGVTWTGAFVPQSVDPVVLAANLRKGTFGSLFVAVGQLGTILTSPDAVTWTARTSGTSVRLRGAAANDVLLVAVGETGTVLASDDSATWSPQVSGVTETLRGVATNSTRFVAVGGRTASLIRYSDDGATWSGATTVPALGALRAVTYGNGKFVAVGANGTVLTSPDGLTWTQQNANSTDRLDGALWSGTQYTVLTSTGKVLTSSDGISWSSAQSTPPSWIEGLYWNSSLFVAVGASGKVKTSPDGSAWTWQTSNTTNTLHGVAWTGAFAPQTADPVALAANLRKITVSGVTASPKTYDGTTAAVINTSGAALVGVNSGDTVTLSTVGATGAFAARSAGSARTVNVSGLSISGTNAGDYTLVQPSATADITAKTLNVSGATVAAKIYDGTTAGSYSNAGALLTAETAGTGATNDGTPYTVDTVSLNSASATATFGDASVNTSKAVTAAGFALTGTDSANYSVNQPTGLTANITAKALTVSGLTAVAKTYDGTTVASLSGTPAFQSTETAGTGTTSDGKPYGVDSVTVSGPASGAFTGKDVANSVSVTVTGLTVTGTGSGNYTVTQPTGLSANITAKALTVSGLAGSAKTYDGTTTASFTGTAVLSSTESAGTGSVSDGKPYSVDSVSVSGTAAGTFSAKDVANSVGITVTGLSLTGAGNGNYTLTAPAGLSANITAKALTVTGLLGGAKTYDGTTVASPSGTPNFLSSETAGTGTTSDGKPYSVDSVTVGGTPTGVLASKDVANNVAITISGLTVTGTGSANYTVTQPTGLTANISAKALTVNGLTANARTYDGTTSAPLSGTPAFLSTESAGAGTTIDGQPYSVDSVSLTGTVAGTFAAKDVANSVAITVSGVTLTGTGSGNYTATMPAGLTANITAKALTVTGVTANAKIYDGTTVASLTGTPALLSTESAGTGSTSDGKPYGVDSVSVTGTASGTLSAKDVATNVAITVTGLSVTGTGSGNYAITQPTGLTANVTAKALTVAGLTGSTKIYDGTTVAPLTGTAALLSTETAGTGTTSDGKPYGVDSVVISGTPNGVLSAKDVANNIAVTISGLSVTGTGNGNYTVTQPTGLTASVTAKALTVAGLAGAAKIYDGTTVAPLTGTAALLATEAAGTGTTVDGKPYAVDAVSVTGTPVGTFAAKDVANSVAITVTGLSVTGTGNANYSVTQPGGLTANITAKALTVAGVTAVAKIYDGTTVAPLTGTAALLSTEAVGAGTTSDGKPYSVDSVSISGAATGIFASRNVANGVAVTVSGLSVTGTGNGNYIVTQPTGLTANITAKALTVAGVSVGNKVYDATLVAPLTGVPTLLATEAAGAGTTADGKAYTIDTLTLVGVPSGVFSGASAASNVAVTVSGLSVTGSGNGNYTVTQPTGLVATIAPKSLTVTGLSAGGKVYDATPTASVLGAPTLLSNEAPGTGSSGDGRPYAGDSVNIGGSPSGLFATKTVGAGKAVTVFGFGLSGPQAGNYSASAPTGLTATISPKALSVSGITAGNKLYDGTTAATLNTAGATLVGVIAGDAVNLVTTGATGTFATAAVTAADAVTITGLSLAGTDATNYSLVSPTASAAITSASATVTLASLSQTYDGTAKAATATTTPANLGVSLTYGTSATAPIDGGTYTVTATVTDPNYAGSTTGTLTIARANQTLTFNPTGGAINAPVALSATSTSGLGVSFSLISGNATVAGSTLTFLDGNPVVVRATQSGNGNYNSATLDRTVSATSKLAQTITFNLPGAQPAVPASITLSATATSGLPVTISLVSGPATLSGNTLTLTGAAGTVSLVAAQAGNATYAPAVSVNASLTVSANGQLVFFGSTGNNDTVAANLSADGKTGTIIGYLTGTSQGYVVTFTLNSDGTFTATATTFSGNGSASSSTANGDVTVTSVHEVAAAASTLTFRGSLVNGALSGTIQELNLPFTTAVQPPAGPTAPIAGYYQASSTNTASGSTYSIVGTQGQVFILAVTPTVLAAGTTTVAANNTFSLQTAQTATISGSIDPSTSTVTGTISVPGKPADTFSGSNTAVALTDRLVNLSSRARIAADGSGVLITGFVIGGSDPKRVLLRAVGPTLTTYGVQGVLVDPKLQLFDSHGQLVIANDDWSGSDVAAAASAVGAFPLAVGSKDASVLVTLQPGAYTMQVMDGGGTGVALAEIYDASTTPPSGYQRLVNISSRGIVGAGENALIGGFVVTGNTPKRVLVRGTGPALTAFGVTGVLTDPVLKLYDSTGKLLAQNDNWETPAPAQTNQTAATAADIVAADTAAGAFGLTAGSKDAALIITLAPGAYSAQVTGVNNGTGAALVEIYELP